MKRYEISHNVKCANAALNNTNVKNNIFFEIRSKTYAAHGTLGKFQTSWNKVIFLFYFLNNVLMCEYGGIKCLEMIILCLTFDKLIY